MKAIFFATPAKFRKWLEKHYPKETELIVGFYKVDSGKPSITWSQSVDQALCFGWIDGVRRSIDEESYCIRFTPRRPNSIWSAINIKKVEELRVAGLMTPAGEKAFAFLDKEKKQEFILMKMNQSDSLLHLKNNLERIRQHGLFSSRGTFLQKDNDPLGHECEAREDKALTAGKDNKHKCAA